MKVTEKYVDEVVAQEVSVYEERVEKHPLKIRKGVFKYYVSKFSLIWDPPPPPASAKSAQALTPQPP